MTNTSGRHFLQIPGPSNVPDRVLRAIDRPVIDHRGPQFATFGRALLEEIRPIFRTDCPVIIYPASGTGAWEAALVNVLSAGDKVLMCETGHFAAMWQQLAARLGLITEVIPTNWRNGVDAEAIEAALTLDDAHQIRAVCVVHNETSTGVASRIPLVRKAIDAASHPALLLVDTISSLGSIEYCMDEWGVDVTIAASQKGLMLPPGLAFNAVSDKAVAAMKNASLPNAYWRWDEMLAANASGFFPYTPATNLLFGLREAIMLLQEEGLENVFARHTRHAAATRRAVDAWGLQVVCENPKEHSAVLTAVYTPERHSADTLRQVILDNFDMSLGTGLGRLAGKVFRIGHLGSFNDLMLAGTLSGVEMGLEMANVPHQSGGAQAALEFLAREKAAR